VVSDVRLYRDGLTDSLGRHNSLAIVGTASTSDEAVAQAISLRPDVVIVDMAMPDSLGTVRCLKKVPQHAAVVAFAVAEVEHAVLACAEAGVAGYVPRDASIEDLVAAVHRAARGEALCSPRIAATLFRRVAALAAELHPVAAAAGQLTGREREIIALIDAGMSNKEIAQRLSIEVATVKNHVHNVLDKLQVNRRGQAAARLRAAGSRLARGGLLEAPRSSA
jgi:DNA-binding NarL/FixJ family response regulator